MAPKKVKAQASSSSQQQQSQAEAPRPTRGGRKRRTSDASNASERPGSSQSAVPSTASTPAKRRKRKAAAVTQEEAIVEEQEEEDERFHQADASAGAAAGHDPMNEFELETIDASQSSARQVHFQGGSGQDEMNATSTATHMTPHPRKMSIKRRLTASPGEEVSGVGIDNGTKRIKITTRSSLPGNASQDKNSALYMLEEREFAPLREVLLERVRRLQQKREENGVLDDEMLVLDNQGVAYPLLPIGTTLDGAQVEVDTQVTTSIAIEQRLSQSQSQQTAWDEERRKFHDSVLALSREAHDSKAKLNMLRIELQALHVGPDNDHAEVDVLAVVSSIRESFNAVRESLLTILPDTVPDDISNQDLLEIIIANLRDFAHRLRTQDKELAEKTTLLEELGNQVQGLLNHLAEAELRKQKLESRFKEVDETTEDKDREIEELQEELQIVTEERDAIAAEAQAKLSELRNAQGENVNFAKTVTRLSESLEHYRSEEVRLQAIIEKMEIEHRTAIASINQEREDTVMDLEDRFDEETTKLGEAEQLATERQTKISTLEVQILDIRTIRDSLAEELDRIKLERDTEKQAKEQVEADLVDREVVIGELEERVNVLETELAELNTEIHEYRQLNETERTQREAAEEDLDDRNAQIGELNRKLHEAGLQANELRTQLFGAQEERKKEVTKLEVLITERDDEFQTAIKDEVERRDAAEQNAQQHADNIADLEAQLLETEQHMQTLLAQRDTTIETAKGELALKDNEIVRLGKEVSETQVKLDRQVVQSNRTIAEYEDSIATLKANLTELEEQIEDLQQDSEKATTLHDSEMEARNSHIAELNHNIVIINQTVVQLETAKAGLEGRVEQEATQMLQMQADKDNKIDDLEQKIRDQHALAANVEQKARAAEQRWQDVLAAREQEIEELSSREHASTETIGVLTADLAAIRKRFAEYVALASARMAAVQKAFAAANAEVDEGNFVVQDEGARLIEEIEGMASVTELTVTTAQTSTSHSHKAKASKMVKGKKRVKDSGIGMEEDGMMAG